MNLPRRNNVLLAFLVFACVAVLPSGAVTKIAVFPLVNKTQDKSLDWISALVPEYFSRQVPVCAGLHGPSGAVGVERGVRRRIHRGKRQDNLRVPHLVCPRQQTDWETGFTERAR
jgi:hypothetical protein